MKVKDLIELLKEYMEKHGADAQIFVASTEDGLEREEIYIDHTSISTTLTSRGPLVEW